MGNCLRDSQSKYEIEVIPPSDHEFEELPTFEDRRSFKIPVIINQTNVRGCFKKEIAMLSVNKPNKSLILSTEDTE